MNPNIRRRGKEENEMKNKNETHHNNDENKHASQPAKYVFGDDENQIYCLI